jgi:hypothetical protein
MVWPEDVIFPHLAFGGGWETQFVVVNMTGNTITVKQPFYDTAGNAISVSYRTVPDGAVTTSTSAEIRLGPYASYNIVVQDTGGSVQTGWSELIYNNSTNLNQLGGHAIFRSHIAGRPDFEAVVPLGSYNDPVFFIPYDNSGGYVTSMALVNPDFSTKTTAYLDFADNQGNLIMDEQSIDLAPGQQVAFSLTDKYPDLAGKVGLLYVSGDTEFLSGLGFRFNPGGAFATVPIMNWSCMVYAC